MRHRNSGGDGEWRDLREPVGKELAGMHEVVMGLEIQPELGISAAPWNLRVARSTEPNTRTSRTRCRAAILEYAIACR